MHATKSLGGRLDAIFDLVKHAQKQINYDVIWDCGCDHGYLGQKILAAHLCKTLCFVDQLPHIIEPLTTNLSGFPADRYRTIIADAGQLEFPPNQSHLVILAGIGGERIVDILHRIRPDQGDRQIDFLLCPSTAQYDLREYLATTRFSLMHESIISEKGRDYEVILIRNPLSGDTNGKVSLTGKMWDINKRNHHRYHQRVLTHYKKQCLGQRAKRAEAILRQYKNCMNRSC